MLKVTISTTVDTQPAKTVSAEATVQSVIDEYKATTGANVSGNWSINGDVLNADELGMTFGALGFDNTEIRLTQIALGKNA